jgi:hypothetical protein
VIVTDDSKRPPFGGLFLRKQPIARGVRGGHHEGAVERDARERLGLIKETSMPHINRDPVTAETGQQIPVRPHDSGSAANETVDGLDATTEALRRAAEDTPAGDGQGKIEKTPVFDRADLAPKI